MYNTSDLNNKNANQYWHKINVYLLLKTIKTEIAKKKLLHILKFSNFLNIFIFIYLNVYV